MGEKGRVVSKIEDRIEKIRLDRSLNVRSQGHFR